MTDSYAVKGEGAASRWTHSPVWPNQPWAEPRSPWQPLSLRACPSAAHWGSARAAHVGEPAEPNC